VVAGSGMAFAQTRWLDVVGAVATHAFHSQQVRVQVASSASVRKPKQCCVRSR
jgi:hypothetical protein